MRITKEAPTKEATEKKLRAALKHAKEAAAKERSELTAQLEAAQQAASDAQAQAQRLTADLSQLQVRDCVCYKLQMKNSSPVIHGSQGINLHGASMSQQ